MPVRGFAFCADWLRGQQESPPPGVDGSTAGVDGSTAGIDGPTAGVDWPHCTA